jgi:hypothetical protein
MSTVVVIIPPRRLPTTTDNTAYDGAKLAIYNKYHVDDIRPALTRTAFR